MRAASRTRSPAIPSLPGNTPSSARIYRDDRPQRVPRSAVRARHAEAFCRDRRRARAEAVAFGEPVRPDIGIFRNAVAVTLAWSASLGAVALLLQAGVIGAVLMKSQTGSFETASLRMNEPASGPITRDLGSSVAPTRALVRFRRKPASPTSPRCSTITRLRSSTAPRAACSVCSSARR